MKRSLIPTIELLPDRISPSELLVPSIPLVIPVGTGVVVFTVPLAPTEIAPIAPNEENCLETDPGPQESMPPQGVIIIPSIPPSGPIGPGI